MGKIFYLMGKSSSGKDTIYKELLQGFPKMKRIVLYTCLLYTSPSPRDGLLSRMPSSA